MAYSADVVRRARRVLESKKADHESQQAARLQEKIALLEQSMDQLG